MVPMWSALGQAGEIEASPSVDKEILGIMMEGAILHRHDGNFEFFLRRMNVNWIGDKYFRKSKVTEL
jgi:hypothetical protein